MNCVYDFSFKTKYEFKDSVSRHAEIVFEWKKQEYGLFWVEGDQWVLCKQGKNYVYNSDEEVYFKDIEDLMNYKIDGERLIDICTKIFVMERTF